VISSSGRTQGLDGNVAYNVTADGTAARAGDAAARDRRIELLQHRSPWSGRLWIPQAKLANPRSEGPERLVDDHHVSRGSWSRSRLTRKRICRRA
jgi:hypothetical protein